MLAAPAEVIAEVIGGQLYTQPRPATPHARATSSLGGSLMGPFDHGVGGPGGWIILDEPELHLGGLTGVEASAPHEALEPDIVVPDLAGWRRTRMSTLPCSPFITLAPDWVCEVISPSSATHDRIRKMALYLREGVPFVWLVDPAAQLVEVFVLDAKGATEPRWSRTSAASGDASLRAPPFEAIEINLQWLWIP